MDKITPKAFGEMIKDARIGLGLTLTQVTEDTGVLRHLLTNYERGRCFPAFMVALRLTKYLGISLDDLREQVSIPADFPGPKLVRPQQTH